MHQYSEPHRPASTGEDNPFLTRLRLLTEIGEPEVAALDRLCFARRTYKARTEIAAAGERRDRVHILLDGWACRYRLLPDGRRQITLLLLPGDVCDFDVLYLSGLESSLATLTACTVAVVDATALRDLAAGSRPMAGALGWLGSVENAMLGERNACLGRRSAREHLSHFLCELLVRLSVVGRAQAQSFTLPLTQEEIGDVLGLTAVHVNRVLNGLRADGLIEQRGRTLTVLDWRRLRQAAGFRPDYLHLEGVNDVATRLKDPPWAFALPQPATFGLSYADDRRTMYLSA